MPLITKRDICLSYLIPNIACIRKRNIIKNLGYCGCKFSPLDLGQFCTYKTTNTLGQGQEPHAPTMNGGALAKEPPMPKLEF